MLDFASSVVQCHMYVCNDVQVEKVFLHEPQSAWENRGEIVIV